MNIPLPTLITFILYLVGTLVIGVIAWRLTNNLSDYILGGRKLSASVTALSAGASDMSGWLLLGLPGAIYLRGMSEGVIGLGLVIGAYLNWKFIAPRLRVFTEKYGDSVTLPDYFENRFNDKTKALRVVSAAAILIFFTFYTASGLVAGATLFNHTFNMNYQMALWIGAVVIVSYTFLGGFLAVSWTDFFQGLLMLLALVVAPITAIYELGGWNETTLAIAQAQQTQSIYAHINPLDPFSGLTIIGGLSLLAWGFGYVGQPHILARFMAIDKVENMGTARRISMSWMIISLVGSILTGLVGIAYFQVHPELGVTELQSNSEAVFILMTQVLFNPWVSGILLAAILAAVMSTIDSQLLVCSSAITEDFYRSFFRKNASQNELVWVGRISVLILALIAIVIASDPNTRVLSLVSYAWAGLGSAFGPLVLLSVLWKRMNKFGAMAGIVVGAFTVIIWKQLSGGIFDLYEMFPAFILSLVSIVVVSLLTTPPEQALIDCFEDSDKALADC